MANGMLARYADASFDTLHEEASPSLQKLVGFFRRLSKETLYKDSLSYYIYGDYRVGKTWICHAILNFFKNDLKEPYVHFIDAPTLQGYFNTQARKDDSVLWVEYLGSVRILVIDDFGQEYRGSKSGFVETKFENLLRYRFNNKKVTIICTNGSTSTIGDMYSLSLQNFISNEYIVYHLEGKNMSSIIRDEKVDEIRKRY
jgi:DNA replication protein DnaC